MSAHPPLKWAGGKRQLLPRLRPLIDGRLVDVERYHEPFVGGGALFFDLAATHQPLTAFLTDKNERLMRMYGGIRNDVEGVIWGLLQCSYNKEFFYEMRKKDVDNRSDTDIAVWMIYLNRCGFNGLYRVNKAGKFNVPFGKYDNPTICDIENLRAVAEVLKTTTLQVGDFDIVLSQARKGDLVYFDPPYMPVSKTSNFTGYTSGGFGYSDHVRLAGAAMELVDKIGAHVLVSSGDGDDIRALYPESVFEHVSVQATRSVNSKASKRGAVQEWIFASRT